MAFSSLVIQITTISLLSSPLSEDAMPDFFSTILGKFDLLVKNIENIKSHMALFLLRHCFWIPKLNYFLRCCPFWKFKNYCKTFDEKIQSTLEKIQTPGIKHHFCFFF
jgi:hypothetical protein